MDVDFTWPVSELVFRDMTDDTIEDDVPGDNAPCRMESLWSQMIPLTKLFGQVKDLNYALVHALEDPSSIAATISLLSEGLRQWELNLPTLLRETKENLTYYAAKGLGHVFVALHVGYHYHQMLLHYQFLHTPFESPVSSAHKEYAYRCRAHATAISNLLWRAHDSFNVNCVWVRVGHVLVISSSVHLHTLLLELNRAAVSEARELLQCNFQLLLKLRQYWPWIDQAMRRLKAFQEACGTAQQVWAVFRMSDWMARFLHEYSTAVVELDSEIPPLPADLFNV